MSQPAAAEPVAVRKREREREDDFRASTAASGSPSQIAQTLLAWCESKDPSLLRDKVESQSFTMVDMTTPGQPITFASRGFQDMSGYRIDEIVGRNCRFLQGCVLPALGWACVLRLFLSDSRLPIPRTPNIIHPLG